MENYHGILQNSLDKLEKANKHGDIPTELTVELQTIIEFARDQLEHITPDSPSDAHQVASSDSE